MRLKGKVDQFYTIKRDYRSCEALLHVKKNSMKPIVVTEESVCNLMNYFQ